MSNSLGKVTFGDGLELFYEYVGSVDVVTTKLRDSELEVRNNWRSGEQAKCICGKDEPVKIYTSYGYGFSWPGKACRNCKAITSGFSPHEEDNG